MTNSSNRGSPGCRGACQRKRPSVSGRPPAHMICPRPGSVFRITAKGGDQDNGTPENRGIRRSVSLSFLVCLYRLDREADTAPDDSSAAETGLYGRSARIATPVPAFFRHPGKSPDPELQARRSCPWIPAFAGMTIGERAPNRRNQASLISTATPAARSSFISASTVCGVGCTMSSRRL